MSDYRWGEVVGILKVDKFGFCLLLLVGVCSRRMVDAIVGFSSPCWDALSFCLRRIVDYTRHLLVKLLLHSGPSPDNDDDNDDRYNDDDDGGGYLCDFNVLWPKTWTATSQARCDFPVCSPSSASSLQFFHPLCPSPNHDHPQAAAPPPRCCCASS